MDKETLLDIFNETESIYLDGFLNGHELPEPKNHLLFVHNEISTIRKTIHNNHLNNREINKDLNIFVEKGDSFSYVINNKDSFNTIPLVLNFANPINPGGGVRRGARAQEEDLCRASNLLYALESEDVEEYYRRNRHYDRLGNDNAILSENISIIRHTNGELLDKPIPVSVLTIAAPILTPDYDRENPFYREKLAERIKTILNIAEYYNYKTLILGAWGCGAFHNDPNDVARIFAANLAESKYSFDSVYFVIKADSPRGENNFKFFKQHLNL